MDYLSKGFIAHNFDMKWLHREILNSDTYQRSWKPNETNKLDEKNFSHMVLRRVPAEVALDAITQATGSGEDLSRFAGDIDRRAIGPSAAGYDRKGNSSYALTTFGKPARVANCDCERTADPTLLQTLFTRNDPELLTRLESGKGSAWIDELRRAHDRQGKTTKAEGELQRVRELKRDLQARREKRAASGAGDGELKQLDSQLASLANKESRLLPAAGEPAKPPVDFNADPLITEAFLRTVSRPPTAEEMSKAREDIAAAASPINGLRDVLWAMLNTREFLVNH